MDLNERFLYLFLGMALGAILGYVARLLQELRKDVGAVSNDIHDIKEEVDEIDAIVKATRERNDDGFMRVPWVADILVVTVLALTFWAAWSTGETNNKLENAIVDLEANQTADNAQELRIQKVSLCTLEYTSKTIAALNERTEYTAASAQANVQVLQAQQTFLEILLRVPPPSDQDATAALRVYTDSLVKFNDVAAKQKAKTDRFPYPTNEELAGCLGVDLEDVETGKKDG